MHPDRISSHIPSFDVILSGGFLPGSVILLLSEYGAGGREFLQTSVVNCARSPLQKSTACYRTSRTGQETVLQNLLRMFPLSAEQFSDVVSFEEIDSLDLHTQPAEQLFYLDSLTRFLPRLDDAAWYATIDSLYEYAKAAKGKPTVSLFLLASGALTPQREAELKDCFDAVLSFRWEKVSGMTTRNRELFIEMYDGMPFFAAPKSYHIRILPESGFEISNLRRIQ